MSVTVNPLDALPNKKSQSQDWIAFWQAADKRYGTDAATVAFVKAWAKRRGPNADASKVSHDTGINLDKSFLEGIESKATSVVDVIGGTFSTANTGMKIILYATIGLTIILVGGLVVRVVTMSAQDAGVVAGTAAKAFV